MRSKRGLAGEVAEEKDCMEQEIKTNFANYSPEQEERQYVIWVIAYFVINLYSQVFNTVIPQSSLSQYL